MAPSPSSPKTARDLIRAAREAGHDMLGIVNDPEAQVVLDRMATEQEERQRPLMIRGDRLLLALDVLVWELGRDRAAIDRAEPPPNPRGFKNTPAQHPFLHESGGSVSAIVHALHTVVAPNAAQLATLELNIAPLLNELWTCCRVDLGLLAIPVTHPYHDDRPIREFFQAVASGELTEADFR